MDARPNTVISPALQKLFDNSWDKFRIILFSVPFGMGKTATARALLEKIKTSFYSAGEDNSLYTPPPPDCQAVVVDDLHLLKDAGAQGQLCDWIRENPDKHFLLLSRGVVPGWLMPFRFEGLLTVIDAQRLFLDRESVRRVLCAGGAAVSEAELSAILRDTKGYPVVVSGLCRYLRDGAPYDGETADAMRRELFHFMEEAVFRPLPTPLRQLLMNLAPFDGFDPELARMVSGDNPVGDQLSAILHDASMLEFDGLEQYRFRPIFRQFLLWEMNQLYTDGEQRAIYGRAGLYYELRDDYPWPWTAMPTAATTRRSLSFW